MKTKSFSLCGVLLVGVFSLFISSAQATTILIDVGQGGGNQMTTSSAVNGVWWNNLDQVGIAPTNGSPVTGLVDTNNTNTFVIATVSAIGGTNTQGAGNGTNSTLVTNPLYPALAAGDSMFASGGTPDVITFSGLDTGTSYNFTLLASRAVNSSDTNRTGKYTVAGVNSASILINAAGGTGSDPTLLGNTIASVITGITPGAGGVITISFYNTATDGSTGGQFAYLNVIQIDSVPEPATMALLGSSMLGGIMLVRRRRRGMFGSVSIV